MRPKSAPPAQRGRLTVYLPRHIFREVSAFANTTDYAPSDVVRHLVELALLTKRRQQDAP